MSSTKIRLLVFAVGILNFVCTAHAQKIPDEKIKEILLGNWTNGNGLVVFNKDGRFEDFSGTYQIKNLIDRDPNAKPKVELHESTGGEWYVTDSILKKRYLIADGKKLVMGKQFFETCTIQNISPDKFQCFYLTSGANIVWERVKAK